MQERTISPHNLASSTSSWISRIHEAHHGNDRPAFHDSTGAVTGAQLIGKAVSAAEFLVSLDTPGGAAVPALVTTSADTIGLLLGGAAADRPLAPVGPRLAIDEVSCMVANTGSPILLAEPAFGDIAFEVQRRSGVRVVMVPTFELSLSPLPTETHNAAFVLHTAGTTGVPKPVAMTDSVMLGRALLLEELIGFGPTTTFATGSPIHHIGGVGNLLAALTAGGAAASTTRFSADWWSALSKVGVTHALLVPTMIEMLLGWDVLDSVPLSTLVYGAAPMRAQTVRRVIDLMPDVDLINLFGQTEGSPITCLNAEDHRRAGTRPQLLTSVGRAVPGLQLRIHTPDGSGTGEVLASAAHLVITAPDGWLHTGDLGEIDSEGYLRLRGRRHDKIVRGGENVYPLEVENVIGTHPKVKVVGVVGVPDDRLGETIAAFIVPSDVDDPPGAEELYAWSRPRMAGFKVPAYWHITNELPLSTAGKLLRYRLRDAHLAASETAGRAH
jgi:acyl-CoA synthetase (AMP-forming)/AMP-acid ligase II